MGLGQVSHVGEGRGRAPQARGLEGGELPVVHPEVVDGDVLQGLVVPPTEAEAGMAGEAETSCQNQ